MGKIPDLDAFDRGHIVGFGSRRPRRVALHKARHRAARRAWEKSAETEVSRTGKRVAWSDETLIRLLNANGRLRIWRQAHEAMDPACQVGTVQGNGGSIMVKGVFRGTVYDLWCVYQPPSMKFETKRERPLPTNLTELWIALTNIWEVIPVERFQKIIESMPCPMADVIKARGGPTCY
ncbi:uncharacterized protein TNCV_377861 [Trichonephila clavipes]|nr:uncharacterized protein TNCV_377861 [Trichonephila clavipes]